MGKKITMAFSLLIVTILLFATIKQSVKLHNSIGRVQLPTHQSRQFGESAIYSSMTVGELSEKFGVGEAKIFELLEITPKPADYKLSILGLSKKYNKTREEMIKCLQSVVDYSSQKGDEHE